jgi:hypothetical protein
MAELVDQGTDALSEQACNAISEHYEWAARRARRMGLLCLVTTGIAVLGLTILRGSSFTDVSSDGGLPRLPLWMTTAAIVAAIAALFAAVTFMRAAYQDALALDRQPVRAWTRPVIMRRGRFRRRVEGWLLLYATGDAAPAAPFAAVPAEIDDVAGIVALVVDVSGFPKKGRLLTVVDAATGRLLASGEVASTMKTVRLMRQR